MAQRTIPEGSNVAFLSHKNSWVLGKVMSYDQRAKTYTCRSTEPELVTQDKIKGKLEEIWHPRGEYLDEDVNDLLQLTELHEASLLFCLKKRYLRNIVYTNIGPIVVALNPFNYDIPWYKDDVMINYLQEGIEIERNLPHSWAVAHNTYWEMRENSQNQTILISGESGAGKTEAAKIVVKYLGNLSTLKGTKEQQEACHLVNQKIIAASPILEAFGNAKTVRNDNSSRFGKFMKIQFDRDGFLIGAFATKYLLEKSRIVSAAPDERVYHSFYQVAQGDDSKVYGLRSVKLYRLLSSGDCVTIPGVDDGEDFDVNKKSMDKVGISPDEQNAIWRVVAGILFFLNVDFEESETRSGKTATIEEATQSYVGKVAESWDVTEEELEKEILTSTISARGESTNKPHTKAQATDMRDTVCKSLYDWLFDWLINKINETSDMGPNCDHWIGLLDIFGFEDFENNFFEQVCINLANETLQQHYNNHIFTEDMKECKEEGIDTSAVTFVDNKSCIELLTGKISVLTLLDEACKVAGNETTYLNSLLDKFQTTKQKAGHPDFLATAGAKKDVSFRIRHYAGDVTYLTENMLEKNRDTLKDAMRLVLIRSKIPLISSLIPPVDAEGSRPAVRHTVGGYFMKQVQELMAVINSTNPHWIRCIKPHKAKKPLMFDHASVMSQLRSAGVLDTVKVRKAGYPIRFKKDLFVTRYKILTLGLKGTAAGASPSELCSAIFKAVDIKVEIGQLGKTKVFLRQEAFTKLNHAKDDATLGFAHTFQAIGRASVIRAGLFADYIQMHKARILAERRAKELALQKQREEEERQRKAEEEERLRRDRLEVVQRTRAATNIQKVVRGNLVRNRVFMFFLEQERCRDESSLDDICQMYRSQWDDVDEHVKVVEQREDEKKERAAVGRADLEEYVRFQHPEYLIERRQFMEQKFEEKAGKRKRQEEREEIAARNRSKEAMMVRKKKQAVAAQHAAEKRQTQIKLRAAHRDKAAQVEQQEALTQARESQRHDEQREHFERLYLKQMQEMRNERDNHGRDEFRQIKEEWKKEERWTNEREKRYMSHQEISRRVHDADDGRKKLIQSQSYHYVPNIILSPTGRNPEIQSASFTAGGHRDPALNSSLGGRVRGASGYGSAMTFSPEEVEAERHYRRKVLKDAENSVRTLELLRAHSAEKNP